MIKVLAKILLILLRWFEQSKHEKKQEKAQDERDLLEEDAAAFYRQHFYGMRNNKQPASDNKANAEPDKK